MSTAANIIRDRLACAFSAGRACHAFFISGQDDALLSELAGGAARRVLSCGAQDAKLAQNPDYFELDGSAHTKIEDFRALLSEFIRRPRGFFGRVFFIRSAHMLSAQAQNALLKTLEEPPGNAVFLLTGNVEGVLPTVASRCCVLRAGLAGKDEVCARLVERGASREEARLFAAQSCGSASRGERLFSQESYRALRRDSLDALALLLSGGLPGASKQLAADASGALSFMLSYLSDLLWLKLGREVSDNPDREAELRGFAGSFTIGKIACMIELLSGTSACLARAGGGAYFAAPALNRLFLDVSEVVNQ